MRNLLEANRSYLISSGIFTAIFMLISWLYKYNMLVAFYGVILYFAISLPIIIYRTIKYKKSINILKTLENNTFEEEFEVVSFEGNRLEKTFYDVYNDKNNDLIEEKNTNELVMKEKNEYLTMWTHQVKTPISVISLIAEKEENKTIKTEILKANEYIDQMINYMKIDGFSQDYVFKKNKLSKVINNSIKKYKLLFFEKNLSIDINLDDIDIIIDEKWLSFALQQIIFNSIKYTDKGSIKIYNKKDNPYIIFIKDSGIGIPEYDLKNIVKWGFTGENGRLDKNSTGIGLYLADRILNKFGYDYSIKSELDKGTVFSINLKRKDIVVN